MAVPPHPQQQQRQQNHRQQRMQGRVERQPQQEATPDNDRSATELRALDCNLAALCEHIQVEGFNSGAFSDVAVQAMGTTYHLHRLILSRSSFFRNMLHGPWKEAVAPTLTLHIDDDNVNAEAIAATLAYLYGHHPKLSGSNTFRILAAASFLDLQDLCAICTDFIISELWTSNFLAYQVFAESQDYGIHGERVRNACWGYLCQSGAMELREVLPQLSSQTLHALLTSDELWVPNEEKRFELAMYILLAKDTFSRENNTDQTDSNCEVSLGTFDPELPRINKLTDVRTGKKVIDSELQHMSLHDGLDVHKAAQGILVDLSDCVLNLTDISHCTSVPLVQAVASKTDATPRYSCKMENVASVDSAFDCSDAVRLSSPHIKILDDAEAAGTSGGNFSMEGPTDDIACYNFSGKSWLHKDIPRNSSSGRTSCIGGMTTEGVSCNNRTSWDDESIYQRLVNAVKGKSVILGEEHETFINILESSSLLYCHMTFKSLLKVRKQLEELSFPCKAVNDGLWLQMLLSHRVQEIAADTCIMCCLTSLQCTCRQSHSQGNTVGYYREEHTGSSVPEALGSVYISDSQGDGRSLFGPVRVHVRGPIDGLAGIGRGTTFVSGAAWPPTRLVFSRVPLGTGNRNHQQSVTNDEAETRVDITGDFSGDGLTALVGLTQGSPVQSEQTNTSEIDWQKRLAADSNLPSTSGISLQMLETQEHDLGLNWGDSIGSPMSWDLKMPLRHFPPFRFGVEFKDAHRLADGHVKHSSEAFYAGSLWKVSIQAFNNEYPQGRRTLGLFLHRRKAEAVESAKNVHLYMDSREKVTARYQLICPSKREVMVFGNFKDSGTLLPKAPKGWGWRTALLFDELPDLLQGGALRVIAVVQLV